MTERDHLDEQAHWQRIWTTKRSDDLSWFQADPGR